MSRINFHGPKDVRAIEVLLYKVCVKYSIQNPSSKIFQENENFMSKGASTEAPKEGSTEPRSPLCICTTNSASIFWTPHQVDKWAVGNLTLVLNLQD